MKITTILLSILLFIILPLNIFTFVSPPYGNFGIIGIIIYLLIWLFPVLYYFKLKTITWKKIILIFTLTITLTTLFYYYSEQDSVIKIRKERGKQAGEGAKLREDALNEIYSSGVLTSTGGKR